MVSPFTGTAKRPPPQVENWRSTSKPRSWASGRTSRNSSRHQRGSRSPEWWMTAVPPAARARLPRGRGRHRSARCVRRRRTTRRNPPSRPPRRGGWTCSRACTPPRPPARLPLAEGTTPRPWVSPVVVRPYPAVARGRMAAAAGRASIPRRPSISSRICSSQIGEAKSRGARPQKRRSAFQECGRAWQGVPWRWSGPAANRAEDCRPGRPRHSLCYTGAERAWHCHARSTRA